MDIESIYRRLASINRFSTIEDELHYVLDFIKVSGIGIVLNAEPRTSVHLIRRFRKRGKMVWFEKVPIKDLEPFRNYVIFLVSEVVLNDRELEVPKHVGVLYAEFQKYPERIMRRFPSWQVVRGYVRVGRRKYFLKGVMRVPTYDKYSVLFITHPEDIVRETTEYRAKIGEVKIKKFPLREIIETYRYNPARNKIVTTQHLTTPLFTPH